MEGRILMADIIYDFRKNLELQEKSTATIEKYIRDVKAFSVYAQDEVVTKEIVIAYKNYLQENYAVRSVNSMLASINSLFTFLNWFDLRVKSLKLQQQVFCSEEKELTRVEYNHIIDKWKLLAPKAPIAGQTDFSKPVGFYYEGNTRIAKPGEICTESWLVLGAFDTEAEVESYKTYVFTKLFRFLLLQAVVSQNTSKKNFCFIPDFTKYTIEYNDEMLCKMWGITEKEWQYIDSRIHNYDGGNN